MATSGIVPPFDVAEDRHPGLGLRCEAAAGQQLAFQCGEEALAHGVVVGVTDGPHGWAHAGFPAAAAERQRCILGGFKRSSQTRSLLAYRATPETDPALPHYDTRRVHFDRRVSPEARDLASLFSTMLVAQPGQA